MMGKNASQGQKRREQRRETSRMAQEEPEAAQQEFLKVRLLYREY